MNVSQPLQARNPASLHNQRPTLDLQMAGRFVSKVRTTDAKGRKVEVDGVLDLLSPSVFQLELDQAVKLGSCLFVRVLLTPTPYATAALALKGVVWRVEERSPQSYHTTVLLSQYRFL